MTLEKLKDLSSIIGTWATIVGAGVAAGWAYMQYKEKETAERTKVALEYVQSFGKEPTLQARTSITGYWNPKADDVFAKKGDELYRLVDSGFRTGKLETSFAVVASFYEDLRACTCAKICDEGTVRRFFAKEAYDLYGLSYPYISEQRKRLHDASFAAGLEQLARSRSAKPFEKAYCKGMDG